MKGPSRAAPYVFIGPTLILLAVFSLLPILVAVYISLTDMDLAGLANYSSIKFVGLQNYADVLGEIGDGQGHAALLLWRLLASCRPRLPNSPGSR